MFTIEDIKKEYLRLDKILGIDTKDILTTISSRAVYQLGSCRYRTENGRVIPVSIRISDFVLEDADVFLDTIRHEYAHAAAAILTGKNHAHDGFWKDLCRKIGAYPQRTALQQSKAQQQKAEKKVKYFIYCKACGKTYERMRKGRFVDAVLRAGEKPTAYRCSCGSHRFAVR